MVRSTFGAKDKEHLDNFRTPDKPGVKLVAVTAVLSCFGTPRFSDCLLLSRLSGFQDVGGLHVLRADANRDHAVAKPARKCCTLHEPEKPREPCWSRIAEATPGDSFLDQCL